MADSPMRDLAALNRGISPTETLIDEIRQGRMVILMDDEGRENEGDLIIAADFADAAAINFMAKYGRGLICLPLTKKRVDELGLPMMAAHNRARHETAFTISIEARDGITTGISAADRARTIHLASHPQYDREHLVTPGHVFPLVARDGGVLVRAGHTEAAVDLARLAGLTPAAVICEIMKDDGTMARLPDLAEFADQHGLAIGTITDLIAWRHRRESLVERGQEFDFPDALGGAFRAVTYTSKYHYGEHMALVCGDIAGDAPVLVRVHALNILDDLLGTRQSAEPGAALHAAMRRVAAAGRGVIVLLRHSHATPLATLFAERQFALRPDADAPPASPASPAPDQPAGKHLRYYGIGAQILADLGVRQMILLSNSQPVLVGLEGFGLAVVGAEQL
ncbi:MAG: 3,4-dihydroxy-2-butanone-4-phosphate synthase [Candidatus Symbiobacter sp.]|nr:3,4-dihydroxy-2-butanone-4-phosphate synthase [Candidatus Symbiobacter sp.]